MGLVAILRLMMFFVAIGPNCVKLNHQSPKERRPYACSLLHGTGESRELISLHQLTVENRMRNSMLHACRHLPCEGRSAKCTVGFGPVSLKMPAVRLLPIFTHRTRD